jgi:hypothetical protein
LRKAEVGDIEESYFVDGIKELSSQLLLSIRGVENGQVESYKICPINC